MEHPTNNNEKNDGLANRLNQECYCITLDRKALNTSLQDQLVETIVKTELYQATFNTILKRIKIA
ncbi:hypothetical protein MOXK23_21490 (plasmid) [Moraxella sp. K23]